MKTLCFLYYMFRYLVRTELFLMTSMKNENLLFNFDNIVKCYYYYRLSSMANSMAESKRTKFDDVFQHLNSLGCYQHFVYWAYSCLKIPMVFQFSSLIFAYGTPKFECVSPNVTCPINKCCQNCTSYAFDKTFVSAVSQVCLIVLMTTTSKALDHRVICRDVVCLN